jgi:integrase
VDSEGKRVREPAILKDGSKASNHEEARAVCEDRRRGVREQHNLKPGEVLMCRDSFADVAGRYLAYQKPRIPASYVRVEGIVKHFKDFFAGKLADITPAQVSDYVTMRLADVGKSTVKKELVVLKQLFRLAYDEWELLPETHPNPTRKIKPPKFNDQRTQHLTPEQFRRVLAASPEKMRPIFALLTATGMRRGELLGCKWKYVEGSRILLPTSKNDEPKEVHLNVFAQQVLASIAQGTPDDLLFPDVTRDGVTMAFVKVCRVLGISDVRLHDLRHTFATWLRQRGTELDVIAAQLGHRDLKMTRRYARVASSQVKQAVAGLDAVLLPAAEEAEPQKCRDTHKGFAPATGEVESWRQAAIPKKAAGQEGQFSPETAIVSHKLVTDPQGTMQENEPSALVTYTPQ